MLKLLVVDDEKMTRDILVNYIPWKELGINIIEEADDGISALSLASTLKPDIILSDVRMPKMNGIELAAKLKEILPFCKVVFLSAYCDKEYLKSAIELKAVNYIEKPLDIEKIKKVIKIAVEECIAEKKERVKNQTFSKEKLCLELLNNKIQIDYIKKNILSLSLDFPENGKYATIAVKVNIQDFNTPEEQLNHKEYTYELLESTLLKSDLKYVLSIKENHYIIVHINCSHIDWHTLLNAILKDFINNLKNKYTNKVRLMIGVGQETTGLSNINQSYQTAIICIQRQFYKGYNNIIFYTEDCKESYTFDDSLLNAINEEMKAKKKTESILLIKRIANDIRKHENTPPDFVRNIFLKIILSLSRIAEDRNIPLLDDEYKFILDNVSKALTLNEIESNVIDLIESIFSYIENTDGNGDIVSKISSYITQNYRDKDLTLKSIADALFLTPTYLCLIFKKEHGKTINQFITELRINKAREYLKETDMKLYDIARNVGYNDGKYFTKVFDKIVGMTPKEYREIHCHDSKTI